MITLLRRVVSSLQTIRVRLTLWYVALLTIVLIPFSAGLYIVLQHEVTTSNDAALHFSAQHVIDSLNSNGGAGALGRAVAGLPIGTVVVLYNRFGERIEASTRSTLPQLPVPQPPNGSPAPIYQTVHLSNGDQWRVLTTPLFLNGTLAGLLQVAESEAQSQSALRELALLLAIAVPVTLIIASAGGVFLAGRALRPISKMTQTVRTMRPQDLSQRIPVPATADEVHQLAETFNALLQRLEQSFERERQFTADVSHELRTPLSILRTQVDLALERGPSDAGAALEAMRTDIEHLQRLVSDLLLLARAEHGEAIGQHEPLRLDNLITDTVELVRD
ncbi:MAG: HAMP domain-containing protein, partial [Chloroflexi bacterium]|nr:HAMP domain-containing protein [Chloroflexota bacterium]